MHVPLLGVCSHAGLSNYWKNEMIKEEYFTVDSINVEAEKFKHELNEFHLLHESQKFEIQKSALLVLDMQNYFLSKRSHAFVPSSLLLLNNILSLTNKFHQTNRPIIFTRHINDPKNSGMMGSWWRDLILPGSYDSQIIEGLITDEDLILEKSHYDAFVDTKLEDILKSFSIKSVVICGVMTHLCCESTARTAFAKNYKVFFTIDGTATYNRRFHQASLLNLAHGFARPVLCSEIFGE
jgi:bifunctional isochorismate lyase / aryl carrier protein